MPYQMKNRIRYSELDFGGILKVPSLVNYFQDCSFAQSEDLGVGVKRLHEKDCAWMISFWQIVIEKMPKLGDHVITETWPYQFRSFMGMRNYRMADEEGNTLVWANSVWIYIDRKTGHPTRIDDELLAAYRLEEKYPGEYAARKILVQGEVSERESFTVKKSAQDSNRHVNNAMYVQYAWDCLEDDFDFHQLRVEFRNQAFAGDQIFPKVFTTEGHRFVSLDNKEGVSYAIVAFDA